MAGKTMGRELKRLTAITTIHHSIGANLELEEVSRIAVRELINIVGCAGCAILIIEGEKVKILAERGFLQTFRGMEFNTDMPAVKYIVNTKQAIFTGDILNSPAASCIPHGCSMNSLICTPIIVNGEVKGILHLDSPKKNAFDQEALKFADLMAKEVSIAVERALLYSQVRDIIIRDGLTGCFNRRKFNVDIVAEIARANQHEKTLSFLMVDIDWFKKYNDFHGHLKGDVLLQKIVAILASHVRPLDKVYRYGGEEFAVLLTDTDKKKALSVARRLQEAVELEQFAGEEKSQPNKRVTVSIGCASFPSDANHRDGLIEAADSALYRAKQSGRNQVCAFSKEK